MLDFWQLTSNRLFLCLFGEAFSFSPDGETLTYIYNEVSDDDEGEEDGADDIPTDLTGLVKWLNNKLIVVEV